jgi:hypothetical protein
MLRAVLRPPANVRLDNMSPVQEWHLPIGLHPDLIACVFRKDGKSGDVEAEFSSLCELACTLVRLCTYTAPK